MGLIFPSVVEFQPRVLMWRGQERGCPLSVCLLICVILGREISILVSFAATR
ncbi:hypothetical protein Ga0061067_103214 [Pannonibacter indicus]|uniref:Uncharacterized protein n=1 Tax=Pannonibacter indicus TaxID=466044 RepID=A0A0K6HUG0_9HYPH|nr:hypothetical protein Ga0061067_103214 [Pannonibacter indicus]